MKVITFDGSLCATCGGTLRYKSNHACVCCRKRKQAAKRLLEDKDEVRAKQKAYRDANHERYLQQQAEYRAAHRQELNAKQREYSKTHLAQIKEWTRNYRRKNHAAFLLKEAKFRKKYREQSRKRATQYNHSHREEHRAHKGKRTAAKWGAPGYFTGDQWRRLKQAYDNKCVCCGSTDNISVDHVIPLSKGGTNYITNIQPLCVPCNKRKYRKSTDYRPFLVFTETDHIDVNTGPDPHGRID